ncbi:NUDIX domain-containing protein [Mycoplasma zalophidermidis]|uniref:NUDIX domain-containing protein n=1 Tax=Mycoplasma zalophidermidis TaxID=398174 RepID=A0ABS6DQS2_9MOLU|nr:NUDIX hydrolase [Mycoplasma zalophidermidis]MBU4689475.1 NUDIX domain-containing protein [Mycoplasma zalophidermidis]MBU4693353.1 NUDIX domain-containing protein [Mycoplasma zalophidermidis]MCR8966349.1 NUDIX domain-containing protein [Mycoplasma zalophidermidis]
MKNNTKLFQNDWISVFKSDKGFTYCQRRSINSIAALLFKKTDTGYEFMIHYQPLPEVKEKKRWDQPYPSAITGSIEDNQTPSECCINEVLEEAGYKIELSNIIAHNVCVATTQMNEKVYNFVVDVTNLTAHDILTDGSIFESVAYNEWFTQEEFESILKSELHLSSLSALYTLFLLNK